ncbi:MAG: hypothetical protein ACJ8AW_19510, partial [Rhodopila sp.]
AKGLLEPAAFMDVAEASGMISELSLSVMTQALTEARDWPGRLIHFLLASVRLASDFIRSVMRSAVMTIRVFGALPNLPARRTGRWRWRSAGPGRVRRDLMPGRFVQPMFVPDPWHSVVPNLRPVLAASAEDRGSTWLATTTMPGKRR